MSDEKINYMKTKIQKYKPPLINGYVLRLGGDEIITIKMALQNKLKEAMAYRRFNSTEAKLTIRALRGLEQKKLYVH
jgi:hypothetical protein